MPCASTSQLSGAIGNPKHPDWALKNSPGGISWRRSGRSDKRYSYDEAQEFILDHFGLFSDSARRAFTTGFPEPVDRR